MQMLGILLASLLIVIAIAYACLRFANKHKASKLEKDLRDGEVNGSLLESPPRAIEDEDKV